jgi:hypothetical protein
LADSFAVAGEAAAHGFGSVHLQIRSTVLHGSERLPIEFRIASLHEELGAAARDFLRRHAQQPARLRRLLWGTVGALAGIVLLAVWLGAVKLTEARSAATRKSRMEREILLTHCRHALDQAGRLLHFEGYRPGPHPATDWPRWYRDAEDTMHAFKELRQQFDPAESANELVTNMISAGEQLATLHDEAAILGLAGEAANRPAVLHATAPSEPPTEEEFQISCRRALQDLRQHFAGWHFHPLPDETPIGVARELHDAALASYDRLLQPARDNLFRRVLKLGQGKETPEAWRSLADGYLAHQARKDLAEWQELVSYTKRLANGGESPDPLDNLAAFLRQEQFPLPLETLIVQLPRKLTDAAGRQVVELRPRAEHPLSIRLRKPQGEESTLSLLLTPSPPSTTTQENRFHYVAIQPNSLSHGNLLFRPGDTMTASLKVFDQDGRPYVLTWIPAESRSAVYGFELLTRSPRLHLSEQTDPAKGSIAFGMRLIFTDPGRWALPELMPR